MTRVYDIAVVGSGFAGSLMAMIAKRSGRSVVLLERGTHPRFAIGESSTPLANLLLEELATRYDLPELKPLCKWGSWQRNRPHVACGLKRGFTFYHHQLGLRDETDLAHSNQLLVAASPHDEIADTHWYRPDFDAMLVREAQALGVDYVDEVGLNDIVEERSGVRFEAMRCGVSSRYHVRFFIDATGPRGVLHKAFALPELPLTHYPDTQALYSHFSGVAFPGTADRSSPEQGLPYPAEAAAVHHVFDGGWIWVLRFNNGITSAGVAATTRISDRLGLSEGSDAWLKLLKLLPTLHEQFAGAKIEEPFRFAPRLSFMSKRVYGNSWAMLPSAAGFVDPLLSTGFPLTLLGIARLAEILERDWDGNSFESQLGAYAAQTSDELLATSRLIGSLYATMGNFPLFSRLCLLYFAAASFSETARRLGKPELAKSFLLHDHADFGSASKSIVERALHAAPGKESMVLGDEILQVIEPLDVAGLTRRDGKNWYPVRAEDLLSSASKLGSSREEIASLLERCGFYAVQ